MDVCVLMVMCPDRQAAESIARALVEDGLAACGNVVGPVTSVYRWKGRMRRDPEVLLLLKTRRTLVGRCAQRARSLHPYELPEVIAVPVVGGLPAYLDWVGTETRRPAPSRRRPPRPRAPARR